MVAVIGQEMMRQAQLEIEIGAPVQDVAPGHLGAIHQAVAQEVETVAMHLSQPGREERELDLPEGELRLLVDELGVAPQALFDAGRFRAERAPLPAGAAEGVETVAGIAGEQLVGALPAEHHPHPALPDLLGEREAGRVVRLLQRAFRMPDDVAQDTDHLVAPEADLVVREIDPLRHQALIFSFRERLVGKVDREGVHRLGMGRDQAGDERGVEPAAEVGADRDVRLQPVAHRLLQRRRQLFLVVAG